MVRLMLTLAPIACILAAVGMSTLLNRFSAIIKVKAMDMIDGIMKPWRKVENTDKEDNESDSELNSNSKSFTFSAGTSFLILAGCSFILLTFNYHAAYVASMAYSSPSIVIDAGRNPQTGKPVLWDDYREAYFWLRQNTHEDSKILSWWDYGYQMSAMANRTVLVDNNTWNNTHIATVGLAMSSNEEDAFEVARKLDANYVLVIFGGYSYYSGDDINKFLWMVRIAGGVYPHIKE